MRKKIIAGNWKMNGNLASVSQLLTTLCDTAPIGEVDIIVFPPAIYLPMVSAYLQQKSIKWGGQNVYPEKSGAFTGELSGSMLVDFGCQFVLVGHSERRILFQEEEKIIVKKFHHAKEHGMIPFLCVGETLQEKEQGLTEQVLSKQLLAVATQGGASFENCVIAYEPVWAIGTGRTALPEEVQAVHGFLRGQVARFGEEIAVNLPILYGGSVNETNAKALFAMSHVNGALVGAASLQAQRFVEIVKCIS